MKVKVKGLVFVGFAAMIFAANAALADNENTVTSKSFTEATYQHKSGGPSIGNTGGTWTAVDTEVTDDAESVPTTAAVKDYVDTAIDGVTGGASSTYQSKSNNNFQVGNDQGGWTALGTAFSDGTYTTKSVDNTTGIVTIDANGTTDTTLATDTNKLPTAATVKTYVDNAISTQHTADNSAYQAYSQTANQISNGNGGWKDLDNVIDNTTASSASAPTTAAVKTYVDSQATSAASGILTGTQSTTDTTHALTNAATTTALNNKQNLQTGDTYQVSKNGSWTAANGAVSAGDHIAKTDNADGSVTVAVDDITSAAADINSSDTGLTTGAAVYNYVQSQTGGAIIPAQDSSVCTATTPCALVDEAGNLNWRTMATATHNGGTCGNASGTCPTTGA